MSIGMIPVPFLALVLMGGRPELTISPDALRQTVVKLASWQNRNTSSPHLLEAADWLAEQFRSIPDAQVEVMHYSVVKGPRVPEDKDVVEVVTTLPANAPGGGGPVLMGGHFDTINMQVPVDQLLTARAPGANDDASGVSATLEVAKRLAATKHSHPYIMVAFSGEEQGLFGSAALAARAAKEGWPLEAVLSNDMIGNSGNLAGQSDKHHVRVFSEESPKHHGRELARWMEWLQRMEGPRDMGIKLVFRPDRFGRGGDHTSFNNEGFTAVRLVEMHEEYSRQHTENDLPEAMDFDYLARVAKVNLLAMERLGNAAPAPMRVRVDRHQNHDSMITWTALPGVNYRVYWRDTTEPNWTHSKAIGSVGKIEFKMMSKDENAFAVGAEGGIPVVAS